MLELTAEPSFRGLESASRGRELVLGSRIVQAAAELGLILSDANAKFRGTVSNAQLVLLERTLLDPPRSKALSRWGDEVRQALGDAELVPYVWHLVSHAEGDGLRKKTTRRISGPDNAFGGLQESTETAQAWAVSLQTAQTLGARRMVLRTPASLTPGPVGRRRIERFIRDRQAQDLEIVWEPEGLWEQVETLTFAQSLGVHPLVPAFVGGRPVRSELDSDDRILVGRNAWLRVDGSGRTDRIGPDQLDALLDHVEACPNATIIFAGRRAQKNLGEFAEALDSF